MDAIAMLKQDHREVETMFKRYESLGDRALKSKQNIVERLVRELSIHAALEEQILYPKLEEEVSGGKRMSEHALKEHQEVKETLTALMRMSADDPAKNEMVTKLMSSVREHVEEEEGELFPKLRSSVDADVLMRMAQAMQVAKKTAPTRPHPRAPSKPPANIVAGLMAGMMDRALDAGRAVARKAVSKR